MNPSYVEEFNGSDYVCMTGGTSKIAPAAAAAIHHASASQRTSAALVASGIATSGPTSAGVSKLISGRGVPVSAAAAADGEENATSSHHYREEGHAPSASPTPSQLSSESGSSRREFL